MLKIRYHTSFKKDYKKRKMEIIWETNLNIRHIKPDMADTYKLILNISPCLFAPAPVS